MEELVPWSRKILIIHNGPGICSYMWSSMTDIVGVVVAHVASPASWHGRESIAPSSLVDSSQYFTPPGQDFSYCTDIVPMTICDTSKLRSVSSGRFWSLQAWILWWKLLHESFHMEAGKVSYYSVKMQTQKGDSVSETYQSAKGVFWNQPPNSWDCSNTAYKKWEFCGTALTQAWPWLCYRTSLWRAICLLIQRVSLFN